MNSFRQKTQHAKQINEEGIEKSTAIHKSQLIPCFWTAAVFSILLICRRCVFKLCKLFPDTLMHFLLSESVFLNKFMWFSKMLSCFALVSQNPHLKSFSKLIQYSFYHIISSVLFSIAFKKMETTWLKHSVFIISYNLIIHINIFFCEIHNMAMHSPDDSHFK